jgi:hypothetical protein
MVNQLAAGGDAVLVRVHTPARDHAGVRTDLMVERWDEDQTRWAHRRLGIEPTGRIFAALRVAPYSVTVEEDCNLITATGGWAAMLGSIAGTSIGTKFSATAGRIGVGTSSTAATGHDTYLGGDTGSSSTTSYYSLCGAGPTITTTGSGANLDVCTMVFTASFGSAIANFAWNEFGTDNAAASGVYLNGLAGGPYVFLNHGISAQGTKTSGQTWTATETLTFGYPSGSGTVN